MEEQSDLIIALKAMNSETVKSEQSVCGDSAGKNAGKIIWVAPVAPKIEADIPMQSCMSS
jgi:hypothetical protein